MDGTVLVGGTAITALSGHGDVNGDNLADVVVGMYTASPNDKFYSGTSRIILGKKKSWTRSIYLADLDNMQTIVLDGVNDYERSGSSVSIIGDFNGDGYSDVAVGAPGASPNGRRSAGQVYVLFGRHDIVNLPPNLQNLNGKNGFVAYGADANDECGTIVSRVGDVNHDGLDDLLMSTSVNNGFSKSYVLFGSTQPLPAVFELQNINGTNGFVITHASDIYGTKLSFADAGDVNGDGIGDMIIGDELVSFEDKAFSGGGYILLGRVGKWPAEIKLPALNAGIGVVINPIAASDHVGRSVSNVGDFNGDGATDIAVGEPELDGIHGSKAYIIHGDRYVAPSWMYPNRMTLQGGATVKLTPQELAVRTFGFRGEMDFLLSDVRHGRFELRTNVGVAVDTFTLSQLKDGQVQFVHDGSQHAPTYSLSLTTQSNLYPVNPPAPANISFNAVPILHSGFTINQRGRIVLTHSDFNATDDDPASALRYTLGDVEHGQFALADQPSESVTTFSQADVNRGAIIFTQDGSAHAPTYQVRVTDGKVNVGPQAGLVTFNAAPVIEHNQLDIEQGQARILTSSNIEATDDHTAPGAIELHPVFVQHGYFEDTDQPGTALDHFSQSQLIDGHIRFVHDGSAMAPVYNLTSVDADGLGSLPSSGIVNFELKPDVGGSSMALILALSTVGGVIALLMLLVLVDYYFRRRLDEDIDWSIAEVVGIDSDESAQDDDALIDHDREALSVTLKVVMRAIFKNIKLTGWLNVHGRGLVKGYVEAVLSIIEHIQHNRRSDSGVIATLSETNSDDEKAEFVRQFVDRIQDECPSSWSWTPRLLQSRVIGVSALKDESVIARIGDGIIVGMTHYMQDQLPEDGGDDTRESASSVWQSPLARIYNRMAFWRSGDDRVDEDAAPLVDFSAPMGGDNDDPMGEVGQTIA